jgi:ribosomal protein L1
MALVALVGATLPVQAQNVLTVRIESFDALLDDVDTIAVALGQPEGSAEGWLQMAQGALGMPQFDWIDRKNPVVLALPLEGMMLGQNGFVGAIPVADIDAAIDAMKAAVEGVEVDENGIVHVPGGQSEFLFLPSDGYLVFGQNPNLMGGFDASELLSGANLPPGTIAAEFNVDSMRAMIGMAMEGARQRVAAGIAEGAEEADEEAVAAVTDTVIGWLQDLVANTRSVQLALEVTDSHFIVHNHYLPAAGSTLEGFLGAQEGGMPAIARLLDDQDSAMTMVGNVTWTDEATAAFQGFMQGYATLIESAVAGNEEYAALGFSEMMPAMMNRYADMMKCMRGDMVQVLDMSKGMRFTQVAGIRDSEDCSDVTQQMLDMAAELPEGFSELVSFSANGLSHRGVTALSYGVDPRKFVNMPNDEGFNEAMTMLDGMFGEGGFKAYLAQTDGQLVSAGGAGAEASLKRVIDRLKDRKSGDGIDESVFEPFDVGAGLYFNMDFGRLIEGIAAVLPEDVADDAEMAEVQEIFGALGAMTGGLDFQRDALGIKFAMPTAGLSTIAEMAQRKSANAADTDEGSDHGHGDRPDDDGEHDDE